MEVSIGVRTLEYFSEVVDHEKIGLVALRDAASPEIKTEDSVTPALDQVGCQINIEFLHSPNELNGCITQRIALAEEHTCLWELGEDMVLHGDRAGQWVEVGISNFLVMQ